MATSASTWERIAARRGVSPRRARTYGFIFIGAGLLIYLLFARGAVPGQTSTFVLNFGAAAQQAPVPDLVLPTATTLYVLAVVCAFLGGWQLARGFRRANVALGIVAGMFVVAFLAWAARGQSFNLTGMLNSALLRAVPIALAGLSGVICERCAVINIGIEGMMLSGAFTAALMGSLALNIWGWPSWASMSLGLVSALLSGALLGLLLAVLAVRFKVNQIIAGTAINILSVGVTSFLSSRILAHFQQLNNTGTLQPVPVPLLSRIPIIGPVVFEQNLLVYLLYVL
ncbi:MAG: ABC transporter permease, partial [Thermoflexia bacterium]